MQFIIICQGPMDSIATQLKGVMSELTLTISTEE